MILINQSAKILSPSTEQAAIDQMKEIEYAGRNCYASHDKIGDDTYKRFISNLVSRGHESPLEFGSMTVELVTSRAVMAEITRHRLSSFAIESQRYIDETKTGDIQFIRPTWADNPKKSFGYSVWKAHCETTEMSYKRMKAEGLVNEEAREVLSNSVACKIVMKANLREWRHIFELRTSVAAYPQMRELMSMLLAEARYLFPEIFGDLTEE